MRKTFKPCYLLLLSNTMATTRCQQAILLFDLLHMYNTLCQMVKFYPLTLVMLITRPVYISKLYHIILSGNKKKKPSEILLVSDTDK